MAESNEMQTKQQIHELMAALGQKLSTLSTEVIARLHEKKDQLVQEFGDIAAKLGEPAPLASAKEPPKPQTAHADICIERVIGGRKFRFRGFIRDDDADGYVLGDTMLERVRASGDTPNEKEDNEHLSAHLDEWRNDTELTAYYVLTNERHPRDSRCVRYFNRGDRGRGWGHLDVGFDRHGLVAGRAA